MISAIETTADLLPVWMLLSAAFGFFVGEALGQNFRHRKYLEQANANLREELEKARVCKEAPDRALKHHRGVIHDIHRQVLAMSKFLQDRLSNHPPDQRRQDSPRSDHPKGANQ